MSLRIHPNATLMDAGHPEGYYALSCQYAFFNAAALTSGMYYGMAFRPTIPITITNIGFRVTTASTDDPCEVLIHSATGVRLATSGSVTGKLNATTPAPKLVALTYTFQPWATYYIGFVATSTATTVTYQMQTGNGVGMFGQTLGTLEAFTIAAWGIGNAATLTGMVQAAQVPALLLLK